MVFYQKFYEMRIINGCLNAFTFAIITLVPQLTTELFLYSSDQMA